MMLYECTSDAIDGTKVYRVCKYPRYPLALLIGTIATMPAASSSPSPGSISAGGLDPAVASGARARSRNRSRLNLEF